MGRPAGRVALFLLPLWHPVLLAEQIGTLASIAQGPFIMQCAVGGGAEQFDALGVPIRQRPSRFEATLDIVRRLCAGEEVNTDSPYAIARARIAPIPPQPLEVWIGAAAPPAIDRAARLGDAFLIGPEATPAQVSSSAPIETRARATAARRARSRCAATFTSGSDDADATRVAGPIVDGGYRGFDPAAPVVGGVGRGSRGVRRPGRGRMHRRDRPPSRRRPGRGAGVVRAGLGAVRTAVNG